MILWVSVLSVESSGLEAIGLVPTLYNQCIVSVLSVESSGLEAHSHIAYS